MTLPLARVFRPTKTAQHRALLRSSDAPPAKMLFLSSCGGSFQRARADPTEAPFYVHLLVTFAFLAEPAAESRGAENRTSGGGERPTYASYIFAASRS